MNPAAKLAAVATALVIAACSRDEPPAPPVVSVLSISIDANNDCTLEKSRIECRQVADAIKTRYPTSKPRVDICLDKQARFEAAIEVMNAVSAAGFKVGTIDCQVASG